MKVHEDSRVRVAHTCIMVLLGLALVLLLLPLGLSDWIRVDVDRQQLYAPLEGAILGGNRSNNSFPLDTSSIEAMEKQLSWPGVDLDVEDPLQWMTEVNVDWKFFNRVRGLFYECVVPSRAELEANRETPDYLRLPVVTKETELVQGLSELLEELTEEKKDVEENDHFVHFWDCRPLDYLSNENTTQGNHTKKLDSAHRMELTATVCSTLAPVLVLICLILYIISCCTHLSTALKISGLALLILVCALIVELVALISATVATKLLTRHAKDSPLNSAVWPEAIRRVLRYSTGSAFRLGWAAFAVLLVDCCACLFYLCSVHRMSRSQKEAAPGATAGSQSPPPSIVVCEDHDAHHDHEHDEKEPLVQS